MSAPFTRWVMGALTHTRAEQRWLFRARARYVRLHENDEVATYARTNTWRLALAQYLLCGAYTNPVGTVFGPVAVLVGLVLMTIYHLARH